MPGFEYVGKKEKESINQIFQKNGSVLSSLGFEKKRNGIFLVRDFEKKFSKLSNSKYSIAVTSGTIGLFVALKALRIKTGDEVIIQSFTFIAVIEAVISLGAKPIIVNVGDDLNIKESEIEKKINKKTKAIISASMLGLPKDIMQLKKISKKFKIPVIDDCCEILGSKNKSKIYGTFFDIAVWSFDAGKTITTGEGGMVTTNSKKIFQFCKEFIDHGHESNPKFSRGNDTKKIFGLNFRMTEMQAAIGIAQLKKIKIIIDDQKKNYMEYFNFFKKLGIDVREENKIKDINYDTIILKFKKTFEAKFMQKFLIKSGIGTKIIPDALKWHFVKYWMHLNKKYKLNIKHSDYKLTEKLLSKYIAIPIFGKMSLKQVKKNCQIIYNLLNGYNFRTK